MWRPPVSVPTQMLPSWSSRAERMEGMGRTAVSDGKGRYGSILQSSQAIPGADPEGTVACRQEATYVVPGQSRFRVLIEEHKTVAVEANKAHFSSQPDKPVTR